MAQEPMNLSPNSHTYKDAYKKKEKTQINPATPVTPVVTEKPEKGNKVAQSFFSDNLANVGQYLVYDVIIPAAKDTLSSLTKSFVDMMLYGETKADNIQKSGSRSYVSYNGYSHSRDTRTLRDSNMNRSTARYNRRAAHDFDDLVFATREDAELVLDRMVDMLEDYGLVTVASFYNLSGVSSQHTDNSWGWDNLGSATIVPTWNGYALHLPRPINIDE